MDILHGMHWKGINMRYLGEIRHRLLGFFRTGMSDSLFNTQLFVYIAILFTEVCRDIWGLSGEHVAGLTVKIVKDGSTRCQEHHSCYAQGKDEGAEVTVKRALPAACTRPPQPLLGSLTRVAKILDLEQTAIDNHRGDSY